MKAKTIFRGVLAGMMSMSLLLSGMPVMATDAVDAVLVRKTQQQTADPSAGAGNPGRQTKGQAAEPVAESPAAGRQDTGSNTESQGGTGSGNTENDGSAGGNTENNGSIDSGNTENNGSTDGGNTENSGSTDGGNTENKDGANAGNAENKDGVDAGKDTDPKENTDVEKDDNSKADAEKDAKDKKDADAEKDAKDKKDADAKEDAKDKAASGQEAAEELQALSAGFAAVAGNIDVDGNLADWQNVAPRASNASNVDSWKVAYSPDGDTVYFCFSGSAGKEWDYNFTGNRFELTYADGAKGEDSSISVAVYKDGANIKPTVKNGWYGDIAGASSAVTNEAHGNNAGPYTVEMAVPRSFFHSPDFTVTFGGTSVNAADIQQLDGKSVVQEAKPVYSGISIDGNYADWAAVAKPEASCPNSAHPGCLSMAAAVYDGDWFYIYIKDGKGSNASGAGTHSNGKFAIISDLGYETDIQLTTAPEVKGVNGAQVAYVGSEWEIAIPRDQLPKYEQSLSFHFYLGDALVKDIVNLQADSGNNLENLFAGVVFDGAYEDWEDYGHTTIQYAMPGSQESQVDAKGALYSTGDKLYGHVVTNMPQHLQEAGQEFTEAVTIAFNQSEESLGNGTYDTKMAFYPMFVTVDANGNINWNPQRQGLPEGAYEYYIASRDAWHTSTNINNLNDMDQLYGKMMMTIGKDGKDEMEYYLELPKVAGKLGVSETDLKQIAAQYGRIGQQWMFTAGTSTGPIVGVVLCVAAVGAVFWYRKRRYGEFIPAGVS